MQGSPDPGHPILSVSFLYTYYALYSYNKHLAKQFAEQPNHDKYLIHWQKLHVIPLVNISCNANKDEKYLHNLN